MGIGHGQGMQTTNLIALLYTMQVHNFVPRHSLLPVEGEEQLKVWAQFKTRKCTLPLHYHNIHMHSGGVVDHKNIITLELHSCVHN